MSSNSVSNHTRDYKIGLPLRGRPILLITRMITDRIGLHSVLVPLLTAFQRFRKEMQWKGVPFSVEGM